MTEDVDPDGELQMISLAPQEIGNSFALRRETYRRLAVAALSVRSDAVTIRKLRDERPGAIVEIFGPDVLVTVFVDGTVSLFVNESLDCCVALQLLSEEDSPEGWRQIRDMMKEILGGTNET